MYFDTDPFLGRKLLISLTNNDKPIYAVKTDFVSQVYIIRTKIDDQNKNAVGAKTRSLWELIFAFSAAQKACSKLENQAKSDSAVFVTDPLKMHFSYTF